jgi:glucose-1-phosphate cytidylyltransferase
MNIYAQQGFDNFILCLGYRGSKIREYFKNNKDWNIEFVDTGLDTNTGGRIKKVRHLIDDELFFTTYGDGVANVNLKKILNFHKKHRSIATITVTKPNSPFGIVGVESHTQSVTHFEEKPILDHWINGGFFVFDKGIFAYLRNNDILERHTFGRMLKDKQIRAFKHEGFWRCMDTYKDNLELNLMWRQGKAKWAKKSKRSN